MFDLNEKVAIVTGGASGIGRATAEAFAAQGAAVMIANRNLEGASTVADVLTKAGSKARGIKLEATDPASAARMAAAAVDWFGGLDIIVHSAGIGAELLFLDTTPEDWQRLINVDLSGTFYCCQAAARVMRQKGRGGRIITLASTAGLRGGTGRAAYGAAKGGVIALVKVMAVELAPFTITANAIAPGAIETELVAQMHDSKTRQVYRQAFHWTGTERRRRSRPQLFFWRVMKLVTSQVKRWSSMVVLSPPG